MDIEQEIERIIYSTNNFWSDLEKARYVYTEVGKIVEKNTEFFLTQAQKLQSNALSKEEMERIHEVSENMFESEDWWRIICKSGAALLKIIFDRLNINSHLVRSIDYMRLNQEDKVKVYHWIISLDIDGKHYALTLSNDLPNIKNGFETEFFGNKYPKYNPQGKEQYAGEDLEFSIIPPEKLREIDEKINYANTFYNNGKKIIKIYNSQLIKKINIGLLCNTDYYEMKAKESDIYKNIFILEDGNGNKTNATAIPPKILFTEYSNQLIENVCKEVEKNLKNKLGLELPALKPSNIDEWIKNMCIFLKGELIDTYGQENSHLFEIPKNFNFKEWRSRQKSLKCPYKPYDDSLQLLDQVYAYVQIINSLNKLYKEGTPPQDKLKNIRKIRSLRTVIATHFLKDLFLLERNKVIVDGQPYVRSNYINEKFKTVFQYVFQTMEGPNDFNKLGYSEQIHTLNKIIPCFFDDLTVLNCEKAEGYNYFYKPVLSRIRIYTLYNKETKSYEIIFHIPSSYDFEDEFYYNYNLKNNTFKQIDIIEDVFNNTKYEIVSTSLKEKQELNDTEDNIFDELLDFENELQQPKTL